MKVQTYNLKKREWEDAGVEGWFRVVTDNGTEFGIEEFGEGGIQVRSTEVQMVIKPHVANTIILEVER
jgi:hypothetical protein